MPQPTPSFHKPPSHPFAPWFAGSFCFYLALLFVRLIKTKCQELLLAAAVAVRRLWLSSGCFRLFFAAVSGKQMKFLQAKEYKTWRLDFFSAFCFYFSSYCGLSRAGRGKGGGRHGAIGGVAWLCMHAECMQLVCPSRVTFGFLVLRSQYKFRHLRSSK